MAKTTKNTTTKTLNDIKKMYFKNSGAKTTASFGYLKNSRAISQKRAGAQREYIKDGVLSDKIEALNKNYIKQQQKMHISISTCTPAAAQKKLQRYKKQLNIKGAHRLCTNLASWCKYCYIVPEKLEGKWNPSMMSNFSEIKETQLKDCEQLCKKLNGRDFSITSVYSAGFDCAFKLPQNITAAKLKAAGIKIASGYKIPKNAVYYLNQKNTYILDGGAL